MPFRRHVSPLHRSKTKVLSAGLFWSDRGKASINWTHAETLSQNAFKENMVRHVKSQNFSNLKVQSQKSTEGAISKMCVGEIARQNATFMLAEVQRCPNFDKKTIIHRFHKRQRSIRFHSRFGLHSLVSSRRHGSGVCWVCLLQASS